MLNLTHVEPPVAPPIEKLMTAAELGAILNLTPKTITAMASRNPERLPRRAPGWKLAWIPNDVREWLKTGGRPPKRRRGRPRLPTI